MNLPILTPRKLGRHFRGHGAGQNFILSAGLALLAAAAMFLTPVARAANTTNATISILVVEQGDQRPIFLDFMSRLRQLLTTNLPSHVVFYRENLDLARFEGTSYRTDLDLIFANPDGSPLNPNSISSTVSRLCRRLGLPKGASLHVLRHSHASLLLADFSWQIKHVWTALGSSHAEMKAIRKTWETLSRFPGLSTASGLCHKGGGIVALLHQTHEEHTMKKLTLSALLVIATSAAASNALAQDVAAGKTSFTEEFARCENCDDCFLALLRNDGVLDLATLDVEYRIRAVALRKDGLAFVVLAYASSVANLGKKGFRIE